jgi:hypothetical protein
MSRQPDPVIRAGAEILANLRQCDSAQGEFGGVNAQACASAPDRCQCYAEAQNLLLFAHLLTGARL